MLDIESINARIDFKENQQTNVEREENFFWNGLILQKKTRQNISDVSKAAWHQLTKKETLKMQRAWLLRKCYSFYLYILQTTNM